MSADPIRYRKIQLIPPAFPTKGMILLSSPKLEDSEFYRTIVLVVKHSIRGSFGLILNKMISIQKDVLPLDTQPFSLFQGGPVSKTSLFFLHDVPGIDGAKEVIPGVFFGGKISPFMLFDSKVNKRIFLGATTWSSDQLNQEMGQKFWIPTAATADAIFHQQDGEQHDCWKASLRSLGGMYSVLGSFPKDPTLN